MTPEEEIAQLKAHVAALEGVLGRVIRRQMDSDRRERRASTNRSDFSGENAKFYEGQLKIVQDLQAGILPSE